LLGTATNSKHFCPFLRDQLIAALNSAVLTGPELLIAKRNRTVDSNAHCSAVTIVKLFWEKKF